MDKSLKSRVSDNRRLLEDPYAHVEYLESFEPETQAKQTIAPIDPRISESRKLLGNPYAYLNEVGGYSANLASSAKASEPQSESLASIFTNDVSVPSHYSNRQIESIVQDLHARLWKERESLWNGTPPSDPIALLDPAIALRLIGYELSLHAGLGQYRNGGTNIEIAGLIDATSKQVRISQQFPITFQTFTAAHELAHATLHPNSIGVHRDRALDGSSLSRDRTEFEADKFATYFLMPEKLVRARFEKFFKTKSFALTEDTAFALESRPLHEVQEKFKTRRALSLELASTESFDGQRFKSMANQFRVSAKAMAIRLEELELVV